MSNNQKLPDGLTEDETGMLLDARLETIECDEDGLEIEYENEDDIPGSGDDEQHDAPGEGSPAQWR